MTSNTPRGSVLSRVGGARRVQLGCAVALVVLPLCAIGLRCSTSPQVPFIAQDPEAPWIMAPRPVSAALEQWGRSEAPVSRFSRRFQVAGGAGAAILRLRVLGAFDTFVNGTRVAGAGGDAFGWRDPLLADVTDLLRPGANEIHVDVRNAHGPALLSLRLEGRGEPLVSDPAWSVSVGDRAYGRAILADDTRRNPTALAVETPWESLAARSDSVLLILVLGVLAFLACRHLPALRARAPSALLLVAVVALAWLTLFAVKLIHIPLEIGFDARHHRVYLEIIRERHAIPLATDGWSTFHPPLFYAAAAGVAEAGHLLGVREATLLKSIPFLAGLASVFVAFALARRLAPRDRAVPLLALLFAAVLPVNLYSSAYFSNESLHTFLAGLALLATVDVLLAERTTPWRLAGLGGALGLAALTKFTALLVVPVALGFVVAKLVWIERAPPARAAGLALVCTGVVLFVAGWFYLRNWLVFGDPLMANWGGMPGEGHSWWQQPGFHTPAYYARFGEVLRHPYLAGFHSFWDSVYSTFWGDGFVAGRVAPGDRHGFWNYDFMTLGYWVALPATGLLAWGGARALALAFGDPDPRRRAALSFLLTTSWVVGLGFLYLTLRLPFFAQAKATYLLVLLGPLALCFGLGAAACNAALAGPGWLRSGSRALLFGWLALFGSTLYLGFAG